MLECLCRRGQDKFSRNEDQQNDFWLHYAIYQTREELRFVGAEHVMPVGQALEPDRDFDVARSNDVLYLELGKLRIEAKLLKHTRVLATRKLNVIFRLRTRDDHLARCEDEGSRLGLTYAHHHGCETLGEQSERAYPTMKTAFPWDCILHYRRATRWFKVEATVEVYRSNDISSQWCQYADQVAWF